MGKGMSRSLKDLTKSDVRFLQKNTNFSEFEIEQWHRDFIEDCPRGRLSKERFKHAYVTFFLGGDPDAYCDLVFRSFDTNGSGYIEFREFVLAMNLTSNKGDTMEKLNWAFSMYDIDGNGTIDKAEIEVVMEAVYTLVGGAIQVRH